MQLPYEDFRRALALFGCPITEKDMPEFARVYDPLQSGKINYTLFNHKVASLLHPLGNSVAVSQDVGAAGPFARRQRRKQGFATAFERKFAQLAIRQVQDLADKCMQYNKNGANKIRSRDFLHVRTRARVLAVVVGYLVTHAWWHTFRSLPRQASSFRRRNSAAFCSGSTWITMATSPSRNSRTSSRHSWQSRSRWRRLDTAVPHS